MRQGTTLVELMVVLVILGLIGGVTTVALGSLRRPPVSTQRRALEAARAAAIRTGTPVTVSGEGATLVRFAPDGRAFGSGVDPLTGEVLDSHP
jgi:prepilin-type N-terminal cleavage/methylation domain-containing protein